MRNETSNAGALESSAYLWVLVSGAVVEDSVDKLAARRLDPVEETNELLMAMARHAPPDHRAVEDRH